MHFPDAVAVVVVVGLVVGPVVVGSGDHRRGTVVQRMIVLVSFYLREHLHGMEGWGGSFLTRDPCIPLQLIV